jgi:fluoride exporter
MPRRDPRELAAIFAGGMVGALARAGLGKAFPVHVGTWPWTTLCINVAGAFALGVFVTRLQERVPPSAYKRPFLGTGFCGALTTFSTMQLELVNLLDARAYAQAAGYLAVSLALGYAAVQLASGLVRR